MRVVQNIQMQIGEVDVSKVKFDLKSRDDIPKILRGLQHLYVIPAIRTKLFALLEENIAPLVDKHNGRPGMTLWRIFVCGTVRLDLNADYDRLHELANQHNTLREMLGHAQYDDYNYHFQTLKDNVQWLSGFCLWFAKFPSPQRSPCRIVTGRLRRKVRAQPALQNALLRCINLSRFD